MPKIFSSILFMLAFVLCAAPSFAQLKNSIETSETLDRIVRETINETSENYKNEEIKPNEIAATLLVLHEGERLEKGSYNGDLKIYPASVVKLFYLAAAHRWLEDGKLKNSPELERALRDMIVDSSNDATHFIVDVLTETSGGAELSEKDLKKYAYEKNAVNRYFQTLGFENINVNQKTYCEDLYGRERQFWNAGKNRNMLTTDATARLVAEIAVRKAVSAERSEKMLALLKRDTVTGKAESDENPATILKAVKNIDGVKVWSKSGWTSRSRHDAAYVETPDGQKFVLVIFTENHADNLELLPDIAAGIIEKLRKTK